MYVWLDLKMTGQYPSYPQMDLLTWWHIGLVLRFSWCCLHYFKFNDSSIAVSISISLYSCFVSFKSLSSFFFFLILIYYLLLFFYGFRWNLSFGWKHRLRGILEVVLNSRWKLGASLRSAGNFICYPITLWGQFSFIEMKMELNILTSETGFGMILNFNI